MLLSFSSRGQHLYSLEIEKIAQFEKQRALHRRGQNVSAHPKNNYDIYYHKLEFDLDPAINFISGKITTGFQPTADIQHVYFDCSKHLTIDSVLFLGKKISFEQVQDELKVEFPKQLNKGTNESVVIFYHGAPKSTGLGSFISSKHGTTPLMWTLSEPYGSRDWWPCKQILNDKVDSIDIIITAPKQYTSVSNGLLQSEKINGNSKTTHWKHRYPIPTYLIAIAISKYQLVEYNVPLKKGNLKIDNYLFPDEVPYIEKAVKDVIPFVKYFDSLFTPYPFMKEKYGHVQMGKNIGGMEHTTISFMSHFSFELTSHELAHQWFGNYITCGSWTDLWLNESFATFLTGICFEHFSPNEYWPIWKEQNRKFITKFPGGSIHYSDTNDVGRMFSSRLTYRKGAYFLHMLKHEMGDQNFYKAIKEYLTDPKLAYGFARRRDLRKYLDKYYDKARLDEFFKDWFYGEGYPEYHVQWNQSGNSVAITMDQKTSHASVGFYEMPVELLLKSKKGNSTRVTLNHTHKGQQFNVPISFQVDSILFDPDQNILSNNNYVIKSKELDQFYLFPNPASDILHLALKHPDAVISKIEIFSVSGNQVLLIDKVQVIRSTSISTQTLRPGTYFIRIESNRGTKTNRFVIR